MKIESFYLRSKENQKLYPRERYPITHSIYRQTCQHEFSKKTGILGKSILILLIFTLLSWFYLPINEGYPERKQKIVPDGPIHLNLNQFKQHIKDFKNNEHYFKYIQVELGEGEIRHPFNSYEIIRQYLNPVTRRPHEHIATYKIIEDPYVYIKLPTRHVELVHAKFPFNFYKFSLQTLKCILNTLISKNAINPGIKFIEKSDIVNYIESEYSRNSTSFNMLILTKCGILVGYLYKPQDKKERAFLPTREYNFYGVDIAFETSLPYFSSNSYIPSIKISFIYQIFFTCSCLAIIYYLVVYFILLFQSFPLNITKEVEDELRVLKYPGPAYTQLLKFDELVSTTEHQFQNQIFIIDGFNGDKFVVIFPVNRNKIIGYKKLPFNIFSEIKIQSISSDGIKYGDHDGFFEFLFKWPTKCLNESLQYASWLHQKLLRISQRYRNLLDKTELEKLIKEEESIFEELHPKLAHLQKNQMMEMAQEGGVYTFFEGSFQWISLRDITQYPVPAKEIAKFRLQNQKNPRFVKENKENEKCVLCLEEFQLNEQCSIWPCSSKQPHVFHYNDECILKLLRTNNACPLCRAPAKFK